MAIIPRKTDNVVRVTVLGSNGLPLTISGLADLQIVIYQKPKTIIQSFLKSVAGQVTTISDAGGVVEVNVDRAKTKLLKIEECKLEVVASFTDTDFADNIRREVDTDIDLATVEDSPTAY